MPNEHFKVTTTALDGVVIPDGGLQGRRLWVIGYVDYTDRFSPPRRHRSGYARRYNPDQPDDNLGIEGERGYNYDIEIDENGQPKEQRRAWRHYAGRSWRK
jgi:hypothetical protein